MTTCMQIMHPPKLVPTGWGHHVNFCVWKNSTITFGEGCISGQPGQYYDCWCSKPSGHQANISLRVGTSWIEHYRSSLHQSNQVCWAAVSPVSMPAKGSAWLPQAWPAPTVMFHCTRTLAGFVSSYCIRDVFLGIKSPTFFMNGRMTRAGWIAAMLDSV